MSSIIDFTGYYIIGFVAFIFILVMIHELGHYFAARMCGVYVEAFSIGFGKPLLQITDKRGTVWKFCPLLLGGYVKMKGEMVSLSTQSLSEDKDAYHNKTLLQKAFIVFAGPLMNLIFPVFCFFIISYFYSINVQSPTIGEVLKDSPSTNLLLSGDKILTINQQKIVKASDILNVLQPLADKKTVVTVMRKNQVKNIDIKLGHHTVNNQKSGYLGIKFDPNAYSKVHLSFSDSIKNTFVVYKHMTALISSGIIRLLTGNIKKDELGGPIVIAKMSGTILKKGLNDWIYFLGVFSINLALLNLLPIPALDGGHLLTYAVEAITRRKISPKIQVVLSTVGFSLIIMLMIFVTFNDIMRLIKDIF